jgi:hypothetical protein
LLHGALHTIGGVFGKPEPGVQQTVVEAMKAHQFWVMGAMRSYWDFYMGLGLVVSVALLMEGIVFWQVGTLAKSNALPLRPILTTFLVGYLCISAISYRFIFAGAMITEMLIALCVGLAIVSAKNVVATSGVEWRAVT